MAPPGHAADLLRSAYRGLSYLPSQGRWVRVRWYFLPDPAQGIPTGYRYSSPVWDLTTDQWPGYGEAGWNGMGWASGAPPPFPRWWDETLRLIMQGTAHYGYAMSGAASLKLGLTGTATYGYLTGGAVPLEVQADATVTYSRSVDGDAPLEVLMDATRTLERTVAGIATLKVGEF